MPTPAQTVAKIVEAPTWDQRVAQIRLIGQNHGTADHPAIYAQVARLGYVPHLAPDFAYIHEMPFYERSYFAQVYGEAEEATQQFTLTSTAQLAATLQRTPRTLLIFRTTLGLTRDEFAHSTVLVAERLGLKPITSGKVSSIERDNTTVNHDQATVIATTLTEVIDGSLYGDPPGDLRRKQDKLDTRDGWASVQRLASQGVPYSDFLHQRHYGGAFRQVLDATSSRRGDLLEDAVEQLFADHRVPFIRTGSHNQGDIAERFEIRVAPAPDFVVFDASDTLRAMLECKLVNDGGTARDKALRFRTLREESVRLGGIPLLAVLGGMGWARVNDTLGPVVRDTEGRVFTLSTLPEMLQVTPFRALIGLATP